MAIKEIFSCDLCGYNKQKNELKKYYFDRDDFIIIEMNDMRTCHRHICVSCIKTVKESEVKL